MATVIGVTDRGGFRERTDNVVVVEPERRALRWIPRDLWCPRLGMRVNAVFRAGGHAALQAALREHGLEVGASICIRREATERVLAEVEVEVPVEEPLDFWYPLTPERPIEEGRKRVSFRPPVERLRGERIHQWLGARLKVVGRGSDLERIERQQTFVRRLFELGFDFGRVLEDQALVWASSASAFGAVRQVRGDWRMETLDVDGDAVMGDSVVLVRSAAGRGADGAVPILACDGVPEGELRAHIEELVDRGFTGVTLRAVVDAWDRGARLPARPLVVTLDGFPPGGEAVVAALREVGWPAVVAVTAAGHGGRGGFVGDEVESLVASGWEIASRSLTGRDLETADEVRLEAEVGGSRRLLAERLGTPVEFFDYPTGRASPRLVRAVQAAGYAGALTMAHGLAERAARYELPRIAVAPGMEPLSLGRAVNGLLATCGVRKLDRTL